nr:RNA-directed DNA polymerase, eukaryota [Tanacetum cinerariifolium]
MFFKVSVSSAEEAEEASQKETDASLDCVKNAKEKITEKLINFFLYYRYIAPRFISTNMYGHRGKKETKKMLVETPLVGSLRHPTLLSISEAAKTIVSDRSLPANSSFLSVTVDNIHKRLLAVIFLHSKPSNCGLATYDLQAPHDRIFLTTLFDAKSSTSAAGANDVLHGQNKMQFSQLLEAKQFRGRQLPCGVTDLFFTNHPSWLTWLFHTTSLLHQFASHESKLPLLFDVVTQPFGLSGGNRTLSSQNMSDIIFLDLSQNLLKALMRFKKKLLGLKQIIHVWIRISNKSQDCAKKSLIDSLVTIDKELDMGINYDDTLRRRLKLSRKLLDLKQSDTKDVAQKSKVQWAIEGDENLKLFHGIINKRRAQLGIRGIFVNGLWTSDPSLVKKAFVDHFAKRFNQPMNARLKLNMMFPNQLTPNQVEDLDRNITNEDIKAAVWACGANNGSFPRGCNASFIALIPKVTDAKFVTDFRPISLIGCVYKVITKILANRLSLVISDLVSNTQFAFIKNRQILDVPFILNEALAWCKRRKVQTLIFKVDFAKAYDSVRCDFLLDVLQSFGFGSRWCSWIRASGLKINVHKSQVMGVGVHPDIVNQGASTFGCTVMHTPFKYLGVTVGDQMSHHSAWHNIIQKVRSRLSNWKVKTLSIGGRLTLLKSVLGPISLYSMSIYKAPKARFMGLHLRTTFQSVPHAELYSSSGSIFGFERS